MRTTSLALIALLGSAAADGPVNLAAAGARAQMAAASDLSAQTRRVRPRVRVYRDRQPLALPYPPPVYYSWPGPNAVRRCVDWYALEPRPSGTVITPQMRCWWAAR